MSIVIEEDKVKYSKPGAVIFSRGNPHGRLLHRKTVTHTDLTDADTSQVIDIATDDDGAAFPANVYVWGAYVKVLQPGAAVTTLTVQIGDTGDPNELITTTADCKAAAGTFFAVDAVGVYTRGTLEAAYAPEALFTSSGANLSAVTGMRIEVGIIYEAITDPDA